MAKGGARPGAGRPPGPSPSTLKAMAARDQLIEMYSKAASAITLKLIEKALAGDILAIKELHDRAYGKAFQPGDMDVTSGGKPIQISDDQYKQIIAAAIKRSGSDSSSA